MPNRIIKESICRSDSIDSLSWFEEVLFYRLIVVCDDYGRFDGRPAVIRGACFPLKDDITKKHISEAIDKLSTVGLVRGYEVQGRPFLQLTTWDCHQQIRAKKSKYPSPEDGCMHQKASDIICNQLLSDDSNGNHGQAGDGKCPRNPIQSESNKNTMCKADADALFESLWQMYPSKKGKGQVSDARKKKLLAIGFDEMARAVRRYLEDLEKDGWRKPQNGSTFFNSGYVDYLDENYDSPQGEKAAENPACEETEQELAGDDWWK